MAVDEINAKGGILERPIEMISLDVENYEPEKVESAFRRLTAEGVDAFIAGYPGIGTGGGELDVVAEAGRPYMHSDTLKSIREKVMADPDKYWGSYQVDPSEDIYSYAFIEILHTLEKGGHIRPDRTIALLTSEAAIYISMETMVKNFLEAEGWTVTNFETTPMGTIEWAPVISKLHASNPSVIMFATYVAADSAAFIKQFKTNPTDSFVYVHYTPSIPEFIELTGDTSEGVVWATCAGINPTEIGRSFVQKYREKWGFTEYPPIWSASALYDPFFIYKDAVERVGSVEDYRAVADAIGDSDLTLVHGKYKFHQPSNEVLACPVDPKLPGLETTITRNNPCPNGMPTLYFQIHERSSNCFFPEYYIEQEYQKQPWQK